MDIDRKWQLINSPDFFYPIGNEGHNKGEQVVDGLVGERQKGEAAGVVAHCQLDAHQAESQPGGQRQPEGGASAGQGWQWR